MMQMGGQGGGMPTGPPAENPMGAMEDLEHLIDYPNIECLNENPSHPVAHCLREQGNATYLESDADPQLLINIPFMTQVKIHHIVLQMVDERIIYIYIYIMYI